MSKKTLITAIIVLAVFVGLYYLLSEPPRSEPKLEAFNNIPLSVTSTPAPTEALKFIDSNKTNKKMAPITELKIEDLVVGTGAEAKSGDTVEMNYLGTLTDGTKFDSSYDRGQTFSTQIGVGVVIQGWDKGVPGMKVGGKRRLLIPAAMAYGERGAGNIIPPNSDLIFEVELVSVK
jgi:FKBP-type peptidyl-prolyl cis-trans isomerase